MTDNVLQSFCERCGARFTQPAPAEKPPPPAGVLGRFRRRTAEAESAPDDAAALPISEAFRDTFHFCMGCRRYNCPDCWNGPQGHCLSCRPHEDPATATAPASDAPEPSRVKTPVPVPKVQPADTTVVWPSGDSGGEPAAGQAVSPWGPATPPARTDSSARQAADHPSAIGAPAQGGSPIDAAGDTAAADAASPADLPWTAAPELDPWRGVVFSSEDRGRVEPSVAPAWEPPGAAPAPPSAPIAAEDVGVLASLVDSEAHVDAADWARASSAVVGSGSLKASRPVEAGGPDEALADDGSGVAAAAALLPEEPGIAEAAEAEEVEIAPVSAKAEEVEIAPVSAEAGEVEIAPVSAEADEIEIAPVSAEAEEVEIAPVSAEAEEVEIAPVSAEAEEVVAAPVSAEAEEVEIAPVSAEAEEVVAAPVSAEADEVEIAPVTPTPPSELGRADEAPLAPLPETEAWLDIARRGFDQMPDLGAGTAETAASPDDSWVTDEAEPPELAPQPTPAGTITPTPIAPQPPGPVVAAPQPAAPLAPPPLAPVQESSPRQGAPATPPPGLAVWATPVDPGPFAKPYQAPPPEATIFMSDAPVTAVAPVAQHGPLPIVPPGPGSPLPPAGQAFAGHPGAPPPASPSPTAYVPPLPGPAPGQLPPPTAPPPPIVAAGLPPGIRQAAASRACPSCSLPLSTKARFCRRCGAPQPA